MFVTLFTIAKVNYKNKTKNLLATRPIFVDSQNFFAALSFLNFIIEIQKYEQCGKPKTNIFRIKIVILNRK